MGIPQFGDSITFYPQKYRVNTTIKYVAVCIEQCPLKNRIIERMVVALAFSASSHLVSREMSHQKIEHIN
jgi:hypothetical protein